MTFTIARTYPTTMPHFDTVLCAVYEYERLDRHAMEAFAFIREHGHNPDMHQACRNAQRRFDSWTAKIKALMLACDQLQINALADLCDVRPINYGIY